jgi:hypothetical protein
MARTEWSRDSQTLCTSQSLELICRKSLKLLESVPRLLQYKRNQRVKNDQKILPLPSNSSIQQVSNLVLFLTNTHPRVL